MDAIWPVVDRQVDREVIFLRYIDRISESRQLLCLYYRPKAQLKGMYDVNEALPD